jgi:Zn-dependent protease with chaperone function
LSLGSLASRPVCGIGLLSRSQFGGKGRHDRGLGVGPIEAKELQLIGCPSDNPPGRDTAMDSDVIRVERWSTEIPLLVFVILASVGVWIALAVSIFGIVYALFLAVFFFFAHLGVIFHVRGSGVRIGPEQFPELHARVADLSRRAGLPEPPAAYVLQEGGSLNAFATKLFRSRVIVLFSDLLEACGENAAARDMVVGHELGHLRAGHLGWMWLILPGMFVPFLGAAYSRARERTCDRYGAALCGDARGAAVGLAILAAGGKRGPEVNSSAFVRQSEDLDTGWMTIARWLSGYPPLCERVALLDPAVTSPVASARGPARALGILAVITMVPLGLSVFAATKVAPFFRQALEASAQEQAARQTAATQGLPAGTSSAQVRARVSEDFDRLATVIRETQTAEGAIPADVAALYKAWARSHPGEPPPLDPGDGKQYGYELSKDGYTLWSSGFDGQENTEDDIVLRMPSEESGAPQEP